MLGINFNVEIKKISYPILFTDNTCTKCGAKNTLKFVDVFGNTVNQEIHPLEKIKCRNCGANYGIKWEAGEDGEFYPTPTNYEVSNVFSNLITHPFIKNKCNNKL